MIEKRPRLLDAFCGAGGCAVGYHRAGFDVVGVDIAPQPHYPFPFILGDALEILSRLIAGEAILANDGKHYVLNDFDAFSASPPCQRYTRETPVAYKSLHPDLIAPTREMLKSTGKPYAIENVEDARSKMTAPIKLCGSMFAGLHVWRHRYFEVWDGHRHPLWLTPACDHSFRPILITGTSRRKGGPRKDATMAQKKWASGIDWMTTSEIDQAIPPAYTEWIGHRMLELIR